MSDRLLTLRASAAQMGRYTRAAKAANAKSRHAWALAVLDQAAAPGGSEQDWLEQRLRWVEERGRTIDDEAGDPARNR
jgi:hypothetical protein